MEKRYLISIDSGGTKTGICLHDLATDQAVSRVYGAGNYKSVGVETVRKNILEGLAELCRENRVEVDSIGFVVLGTAGCDSPEDEKIYRSILSDFGIPGERFLVCNDSELIFRSIADEPGICVVAGTGSIVLGFGTGGKKARVGGWGAPLSDIGSGYWIGAEMLKAYLEWCDGLRPEQPYFRKITAAFPGISADVIPARIAELTIPETAAFARGILESSECDKLCSEIVHQSALQISRQVCAVYKRLGLESESMVTLVETGSLFNNEIFTMVIQDAVQHSLHAANIRFVKAEGIPAENGIALAKKCLKSLE